MRKHSKTIRATIGPLLVVGIAHACTFDSLYGFDSARPSLNEQDSFEVDPECLDLPLDDSATADVPRVVTVTGRRGSTGLGAEGVPVTVRIGRCSDLDSAQDASSEVNDGSAAADGAPASSSDAQASVPQTATVSCAGGSEPLEAVQMAAFELDALEGRGCRARSTSRLDCTLDARGEAAFGVVGHLQDDGLTLNGYLPLCVTPLELHVQVKGETPQKQRAVAAIPRFGSRLALAVLSLDEVETPPPIPVGATCSSLLDCGEVRPRARFAAGIVSPDIAPGSIQTSDFLQVGRDLSLSAGLRIVNAPRSGAAFLSTDPTCPAPPSTDADGGTADAGSGDASAEGGASADELQLRIVARESATQAFYVCAPGYAASYEVAAKLLDASIDSPIQRPSNVTVLPLTEAFVVDRLDTELVLFAQQCGGQRVHVEPSLVQLEPPFESSADGERVVIDCAGAGGPDAGDAAADSGGTLPEASLTDGSSCNTVPLELQSGGTCSLTVSN